MDVSVIFLKINEADPYPPGAYSSADGGQCGTKAKKPSENSTEMTSEPKVGLKVL